jgi:hypothetical protein
VKFFFETPCTMIRASDLLLKSKSKLLSDWQSASQSVSQSVCLGIEHSCGTCNQILFPVGMLLSEIAVLYLLGALSDERTGLQFAVQSLNGSSRAEPETILYCLIWDSPNLEGQVPVFMSPRKVSPWFSGYKNSRSKESVSSWLTDWTAVRNSLTI